MRSCFARTVSLLAVLIAASALLLPVTTEAAIASHQQCNYCHNTHGALGPALQNQATTEMVCLSCHGPGGISVLKAAVHQGNTYYAFVITCSQCHDSHDNLGNWLGGTNRKLVGMDIDGVLRARISTPNSGVREVVFESRGTTRGVDEPSLHSFADNDEDGNGYYDGVCETCHTQTNHHWNNSGGDHTHNTGETCTNSCHLHTKNFLK